MTPIQVKLTPQDAAMVAGARNLLKQLARRAEQAGQPVIARELLEASDHATAATRQLEQHTEPGRGL